MNLDVIRPRNKTKDLSFSISKKFEMLIKQTHRKAERTLKFKITQPRETFCFNPPIPIEGSWMLELTSLELYNSIFNITEAKKQFQSLYLHF